jgi:hypothetical protein
VEGVKAHFFNLQYANSCNILRKRALAAAYAELALAAAVISCIAPNMAPDWLKEGDFSALAPLARPYALYLRAKYLLCLHM